MLFVGFIVPILVGLSLAGGTYKWTAWQAVLPIGIGGVALLLFASWEFHPILLTSMSMPCRKVSTESKLLLGLRHVQGADAAATFVGGMFLGLIVSTLAGSMGPGVI